MEELEIEPTEIKTHQVKSLFRDDGKRLDGRAIDELRPVKLKVSVLPQADGSSYIEMGGNKILVAVYGPRELHPRHLIQAEKARIRVEYRLAPFSVQDRKSPAPKRREHELSKVIQEAVEPSIFTERFPRSGIDIYVQVLDADGGTRCASITATSLALADAGLPLRGLVSAVACGKAGGKVILDLFDIEDKEGQADLPLAVMYPNKDITLCQMDGRMTREEVQQAIKLAMKGCDDIYKMQREVLQQKYQALTNISETPGEGTGTEEPTEEESKVILEANEIEEEEQAEYAGSDEESEKKDDDQ